MSLLRVEDARIIVPWFYIKRCRKAHAEKVPVTVQRHHGYVIDIQVRDHDSFFVIILHTGPQVCNCKRISGNDAV